MKSLKMSGASPYLTTALCSLLAYPVIYGVVAPFMMRTMVWKRYSSLEKAKQKYVQMLVASIVYTSVVGPCALLVHHFDQELIFTAKHFILRHDSPAVRYISAVVLGYTMGEALVALIDVGRTDRSLFGFVLHHVVTCCSTLVTAVYPCLPVYANLVLATEFSTIWLDVRLLLTEFSFPKSSTIFKINDIVFFLSFSYLRVWLLVSETLIPLTYVFLTKEFYALELPVVLAFPCGIYFFTLINLYWYALICKRFPRAISGYGKNDQGFVKGNYTLASPDKQK